MVPGAGVEPARVIHSRDFKSLASTCFATRATLTCDVAKTSVIYPLLEQSKESKLLVLFKIYN